MAWPEPQFAAAADKAPDDNIEVSSQASAASCSQPTLLGRVAVPQAGRAKNTMEGGKQLALERARTILGSSGGKNKLARHHLPGDDVFLAEYLPRKNLRPCIFFPAFLVLYLTEGMAWQQETTVLQVQTSSSNTILFDTLPDSSKRDTRTAAFNAGNLTCAFGKPSSYSGLTKDEVWCPFVLGFTRGYSTPIVWFGLYLVTIAIACNIALVQKRNGTLVVRKGETLLGAWLQIYSGGYTDGHLHLWFASVCFTFIFCMLARAGSRAGSGVQPSNDEYHDGCIRFGNWHGHYDKCISIVWADTVPLAMSVGLLYLCWMASLSDQGQVQKVFPMEDVESQSEAMDAVTAAAVRFKALVRTQMNDTKNKNQRAGATLMELPKLIFNVVMEVFSSVQAEAGADFMEGFGDQLQEIVGPLQDPLKQEFCDFANQVGDLANQGLNQATSIIADPELRNQARAMARQRVSAARSKTQEVVMVNIHEQFEKAQSTYVPKTRRYFAMQTGTVMGMLLGLLTFFLVAFNPYGASWPVRTDTGYEAVACASDQRDVWCHGYSSGWVSIRFLYYVGEVSHSLEGLTAVIGLCIVAKLLAYICLSMLFMLTVTKAFVGLSEAAVPMDIMANVLKSWTATHSVTSAQLKAWVMARKSLLYNEVAYTLDRFENIILGWMLVFIICTLTETSFFIIEGRVPVAFTLYAGFLNGLGTFASLEAAMKCYKSQKSHDSCLLLLKEAIVAEPDHDMQVVKLIDQMMTTLEKTDYQPKIFFLPLKPALLKSLVGYVVTAITFVLTKYVAEGQ